MDVFPSRYYKLNEMLMTIIGQWPYQKVLGRRVFLSTCLFLCASQIIPQVLAFVKYRDDPAVILECAALFLFILTSLTKLIFCVLRSKERLKLFNLISEHWQIWANDEEIMILHEYAELGRKLMIMYTVNIYSTGILFVAQPVLPKFIDSLLYNGSQPGVFPMPVYYYRLDEQKYYFYIIGFTLVCVSMLVIITVAVDTTFIVYVQHGCGIFAALGHRLQQIGEEDRITSNGNDVDYEIFADCVKKHNEAIVFAKLIEDVFTESFFFVLGFAMMMLSVTALQIMTQTNDLQDTMRYIAFMGAQLVHLFIESYIAQILIDHSLSIHNYILNVKWYNASIRCQKALQMMILRCREPCVLTAGKMCVMSVETFGLVLKTSMSYFTLLRSMQ